jgi:hypothetical protein
MISKFFVPSSAYKDAINNKDKGALKALLVGILGLDPTFETTEFNEAISFINDESIRIHGERIVLDEFYKKQEDEYYIDNENDYTESYYGLNLVWLRDNFSVKERVPMIKKIGFVVYKDKPTMGKTKRKQQDLRKGNVIKNTVAIPTSTSGNKSKWLLFVEFIKRRWWWIFIIVAAVGTFIAVTKA